MHNFIHLKRVTSLHLSGVVLKSIGNTEFLYSGRNRIQNTSPEYSLLCLDLTVTGYSSCSWTCETYTCDLHLLRLKLYHCAIPEEDLSMGPGPNLFLPQVQQPPWSCQSPQTLPPPHHQKHCQCHQLDHDKCSSHTGKM